MNILLLVVDSLRARSLREGPDDGVGRLLTASNNMANSWLNAASRFGFDLRLACPDGYDPDPDILARARANTASKFTR